MNTSVTQMRLPESFSLAGRSALVTGSSRGIGAAIAFTLAEAGANVMIHFTGAKDPALEVSQRIRSIGRTTAVVEADFADGAAPRKVFDATVEALGGIDVLVSNVSLQIAEPWTGVTHEHFDAQVSVGWRSAFDLIQLAAPSMLERGWGRIVTIGSVQETRPHPQMVVYAAIKAAQTLMVRNLAKQFAPSGVTVNNIAPGVILTDRNVSRLADPVYAEKVRGLIPSGYFGEANDCVGAALLLCSNAGRYITGHSLYVDGGMAL